MKALFTIILSVLFLQSTQAQWGQSSTGLFYHQQIMAAATSGSNILIGPRNDGVYLSTNNGDVWNQISSTLPYGETSSLEFKNNDIYVGVLAKGIYKSTNSGAVWNVMNNGLSNIDINTITVSGNDIYAGSNSYTGGLFYSNNDGANWSLITNGITSPLINAICVFGNNIIIGTANSGMYLTSNNGVTWTSVYPGVGVSSFAKLNETIFAGTSSGVVKSVNGGNNWISSSNGLTNLYITSMTLAGIGLFAGTSGSNGGVFYSGDGGANWALANSGITNQYDFQNINVLTSSGNNVFAGTSFDGVFYSNNNGNSWIPKNSGMLKSTTVSSIIKKGNILFASSGTDGVFASTDNGSNWILKSNGILSSDKSYMTFGINGSTLYAGGYTGMCVSTNDGENWTKPTNTGFPGGYVSSIKFLGSNIFAGIKFTRGVILSTNNGASWSQVNNGLTSLNVNALEIINENLYVGTSAAGVFVSTNNGTNWAAVNSGITNMNVTAICPVGTNIFASTQGGGVYLTTNGGASWTPINNGIANLNILSLYNSGSVIYAGAQAGEFYYSTNSGQSWISKKDGLNTSSNVTSICVSNNLIFSGTQFGIWKRNINDFITGVNSSTSETVTGYKLYQNYPNPFNPGTVISFTLPGAEKVILKIYDLSGREIEVLRNEDFGAGTYSVYWNAVNLSSGIYFYKLQVGRFSETRKMLLVK